MFTSSLKGEGGELEIPKSLIWLILFYSIKYPTISRRGMQLVFKATLIEMDKQVLLDFRLSRGDGIEFKRR